VSRPSDPAAISIAGEAFAILGRTMQPVVERYLLEAFGGEWRRRSGLLSVAGEESDLHSLDDTNEVLVQISRREVWTLIARSMSDAKVERATRTSVHALSELRHRWAHFRGIEARDCIRIIAEGRSVMSAFGVLDAATDAALSSLERRAARQMDGGRQEALTELRSAYVESVLAATAQLDLAGISPAADARMLRINLVDLFVPPAVATPGPEPPHELDAETIRIANEMFAEFEEVVTRETKPRLAVIGSPGAGKTTLLRSLARESVLGVEGTRRTPILLRASALSAVLEREPSLTLRRYLTNRFSDRFGPLFDEEIRTGQAWLLIDGLDEAPDAKARATVAAAIDSFCADAPDVSVWLTSRPVGFELGPASPRFDVVQVEPFDDGRIRRFSERWSAIVSSAGPPPASDLAEEILRSPGLTELARTPLLLTILALLWQRGSRLPEQRVELYQVATDTLLRDWPFHRQAAELELPMVMEVLQAVALRMVETGDTHIRERDLLPLVADTISRIDGSPATEARRTGRRLLRTVEETTGFFIADGRDIDGPVFRFIHRTFSEYLCARALLDGWADGSKELAPFLHRPEWATTITLLFEYASALGPGMATGLVRAVHDLDQPLERHLHGNLALVIRAMGAGARLRQETRDELLGRGVELYLAPGSRPPLGFVRDLGAALQHAGPSVAKARLGSAAPGLQSRRAVLRYVVDPSDSNLSALLEALRDPQSTNDRSIRDLVRTLGLVVSAPFEPTHHIFVMEPHVRGWVSDEAASRLAECGAAVVPLRDVVKTGTSIEDGRPIIISVDPEELSLEDVIDVHRSAATEWIGSMLVGVKPWHDAHEAEIASLGEHAAELPPALASFAARCYLEVSEDGAAVWLGVLVSMLLKGEAETFAAAWQTTLEYAGEDETFEQLATEAAKILLTRRPELARPFVVGLASSPIWMAEFENALKALLRSDDPSIRGLARRVLASNGDDATMLAHLSEESAFDPILDGDGSLSSVEPELTENLISALLRIDNPDVAPETSQAVRMALERACARGPMPTPYFGGARHFVSPVGEAVARELVLSDRPEARGWGAHILHSIERSDASEELEVLLGDLVGEVRTIAAAAVKTEDLGETAWLVRALPAILGGVDAGTAAQIAQLLRDEISPHPNQAVADVLERVLEEDPSNSVAIEFGWTYLLYLPAFGAAFRALDG
jgi:hypothetical protein